METFRIDGTGLSASRIGLGTWAIGGWMWGGTDEAESIRTIHRALDEGITLIDTAPAYGFGLAEDLVGRALAHGKRKNVVLATKVGLEWTRDGQVRRNATRERIATEIDASLRRLRTDHVDIYFVHWPDPLVAVEETAEAMGALLEAGKIRAIGVSNFSPDEMDAFRRVAPIHVAQPPLNLFDRAAEHDVLPYCKEYRIATLAYGALCRGLLTGKMRADRELEGDDLRKHDPKFHAPHFERYLEAVHRLDVLARAHGATDVLHLAVRWLLDRPGVSAALWGARHPEQLADVADIGRRWCLDADTRDAIDHILAETVPEPAPPELMAPPSREIAAARETRPTA